MLKLVGETSDKEQDIYSLRISSYELFINYKGKIIERPGGHTLTL